MSLDDSKPKPTNSISDILENGEKDYQSIKESLISKDFSDTVNGGIDDLQWTTKENIPTDYEKAGSDIGADVFDYIDERYDLFGDTFKPIVKGAGSLVGGSIGEMMSENAYSRMDYARSLFKIW